MNGCIMQNVRANNKATAVGKFLRVGESGIQEPFPWK
jgi:hypothetical protein